jgi:hypothetical protein
MGLALASCAGEGTAFTRDERVSIMTPVNRSTVTLPVTVGWKVAPSAGIASYLLLVDRSPQPPGETVRHFVDDLDDCKGPQLDMCLGDEYLEQRGIYRTADPQLVLDVLPARSTTSKTGERRHEVVIAPLDAHGRRVGEATWTVQFWLRGEG